MITIYRKNNIQTNGNKREIELRGLATDEKPKKIGDKNIENGTTFIEIDTGKIYLYDLENEQWNEV